MTRHSICFLLACLVTSCAIPKPAAPEQAPVAEVKKPETPTAAVTPTLPKKESKMKGPDDLNHLPDPKEFEATNDSPNSSAATIRVVPPSDPKP
ncbi:MAG: hypothetical protein JWO82_2391 [Akkermansiaceae bacterium]|nr:hypothetical protein [Akkermansiaceae bacterium]